MSKILKARYVHIATPCRRFEKACPMNVDGMVNRRKTDAFLHLADVVWPSSTLLHWDPCQHSASVEPWQC